jgi:ParB family transcriptional regulator, chromosome partitioning protein
VLGDRGRCFLHAARERGPLGELTGLQVAALGAAPARSPPRSWPTLNCSNVTRTWQVSAYALEAVADDLKTSRAWQAVQQAKEAWWARLPEHQGEWFGWLIDLSHAELIGLLALCTSLTVNALPCEGESASANALAAALGLDMADWWEPTPEDYLNHLPKAQIVAALKDAVPDLSDGGVEAMKKDALVTAAASRLAGKRWLPEPLRRSPD